MSTPAIDVWPAERIEAQAPDPRTASAGLKLANPAVWPERGLDDGLLWGLCQGSGKKPYQVCVDLPGSAYKCSCPSRKIPCKHIIGLLHLWSRGDVGSAGPADFADTWRQRRAAQAARAAARASGQGPTPEQKASADARAARREQRMDEGLAELDRWLGDQMSEGLARAGVSDPSELRAMAARMVDAQVPGAAERLTVLSQVPRDKANWLATLVEGYGMLRLLIRAWQRRDELPDDLVDTVRTHLGLPVHAEDVLARPGIDDSWAVLGIRDLHQPLPSGRIVPIIERHVWLLGRGTGRWGLLLSFANGSPPPAGLVPGDQVDARAHPYPGRGQLRCACSQQQEARPLSWTPPAVGVAAARATWCEAVALDPWAEYHPVVVAGRLAVVRSGAYALTGDDAVLPVLGSDVTRRLLALTASSDDLTVFGELTAGGLVPLSVLDEGQVRQL